MQQIVLAEALLGDGRRLHLVEPRPQDAETICALIVEAFGSRPPVDPPPPALSETAAKVAAAVVLSQASPLGPLATQLREQEPEAFASVIGTYVEDVIPGMSWFWRERLEAAAAAGELRADLDLDAAAEWVMRVVASLVSVPGAAVDITDAQSIQDCLDTYLMPALRPKA